MESNNVDDEFSPSRDLHENEVIKGGMTITDDDKELTKEEARFMRRQFDAQRAKMKDLFVKKEEKMKQLQDELNEARCQLTIVTLDLESKLDQECRKYRDELSTLHHILNETMHENAECRNEIKKLNEINAQLTASLSKANSANLSGSGEIPQILTAPGMALSSLARKVTNQISQFGNVESVPSTPVGSDEFDMDDDTRKAREDAEVLRSLVVPLEEEIAALKDKLRETDAALRKYQNDDAEEDSIENTGGGGEGAAYALEPEFPPREGEEEEDVKRRGDCDDCCSLERQLLNAQEKIHDLERHIVTLDRYKHELSKETAFRKDMEEQWTEKKEAYVEQVAELKLKCERAENELKQLQATFSNTYELVTNQVQKMCVDRGINQRELSRLQMENDTLIGKHMKYSHQLQNEDINLPDNVEDLQEMILRYQEELIAAKVGKESVEERVIHMNAEIEHLRAITRSGEQCRMDMVQKMTEDMSKMQHDMQSISEERDHYMEVNQDYKNLRLEINELNGELNKITAHKKHLEETVKELRTRVTALQTELDNSEKVQKDFVLLSQSLQQELETIREAENEVRWEHEEDMKECRRCKISFTTSKQKMNCRHCGRIFCNGCLSHMVKSGPNGRPSKVCDVCHTLLVRDSAPYFSNVPPAN